MQAPRAVKDASGSLCISFCILCDLSPVSLGPTATDLPYPGAVLCVYYDLFTAGDRLKAPSNPSGLEQLQGGFTGKTINNLTKGVRSEG
ncbi:unnamed protein product [Arctogadus glacialis]